MNNAMFSAVLLLNAGFLKQLTSSCMTTHIMVSVYSTFGCYCCCYVELCCCRCCWAVN